MAELLLGAPVAAAIREELKERVHALLSRGLTPRLALARVGDRANDRYYEASVRRFCETVGVQTEGFVLPDGCTREALAGTLRQISARSELHGCLLQRPLPADLADFEVYDALCPEKDLDGMTSASLGALFSGKPGAFAPCTADAVLALLRHYDIDPAGKHAVVIGRSLVIGRPVAQLLLGADATVTVCHRRTPELPALCRQADILVSAAGRPGLVGAECLRPGQIVIDVGTTAEGGVLMGDVELAAAESVAAAVTPVPGGVGAVTTALLLRHLIEAAERSLKE